jgi:hypothetical protein
VPMRRRSWYSAASARGPAACRRRGAR